MYTYLYPSLVTVFALILYFVVTIYVGFARAKYKISPPAMAGNSDFERVVRVHENTLEQLILFLPLLWLFSYYSSINYGTILGAIWIVGRILYAWGYYQAPEKRLIGFGLSNLASVFLLIGSLIAIIQKIIMQNTPAM